MSEQLSRALDDFEARLRDLRQLGDTQTVEARRRLIDLRRGVSASLAAIEAAADQFGQNAGDPLAMRAEFRRRFSSLRHDIAIHQAKWPAVLLDTRSDDYRESAERLSTASAAFVAWARQSIGD